MILRTEDVGTRSWTQTKGFEFHNEHLVLNSKGFHSHSDECKNSSKISIIPIIVICQTLYPVRYPYELISFSKFLQSMQNYIFLQVEKVIHREVNDLQNLLIDDGK